MSFNYYCQHETSWRLATQPINLTGPFPRGTSGTCKLGKLNYFLGRGSSQARYNIDFCKTPEAVCNKNSGDDIQNAEIRVSLLCWLITCSDSITDLSVFSG